MASDPTEIGSKLWKTNHRDIPCRNTSSEI